MKIGAWCLSLLVAGNLLADGLAPGQLVIVANEKEPASRELAVFYAEKRGVPTNQICVISARNAETITRGEFNEQVRDPVLQFLERRGLLTQRPARTADGLPTVETVACRVSGLVLMYGVPLRVEADATVTEKSAAPLPKELKRNEASVESELALLPAYGLPITGPLRNPFFGAEPARFAPNRRQLLVGRLDGPDPATVRRLVEDALWAEQFGLHGRAYFDTQASRDKGYQEGDNWIKRAAERFREAGYEVELDEEPAVLAEDFPLTDVAVYAGWYAGNVAGPFKRETFRFRQGAVAYHIHSSSGASVRSRTTYWAGPLLDRGAAATMGNVFEPYLAMSPHVDVFCDRLLGGATFLEAASASQPVLSWQTTFVGDPLYRPFAATVDEQIARLAAAKRPAVEWAWLRKVNLLARGGRAMDAERLCREQAVAPGSAVLREKLADLLLASGQAPDAAAVYRELLGGAELNRQVRVSLKLARAYEQNRQAALALAVYEGLLKALPGRTDELAWCKKARDLADGAGEKAKAEAWQAKVDELIAAAAAKKGTGK